MYLLKILVIILVCYFFISISNNINKLYEFNTLDSMTCLSLVPAVYTQGPQHTSGEDYINYAVKDNINYEDYNKIFNDKSLILKQKLESGKYILSNLDLSIFNVVFENHEHIFLRHVDINNCYKVEVSILKYNPNLRGNFLYYYLTYTELKFSGQQGDLLLTETETETETDNNNRHSQ